MSNCCSTAWVQSSHHKKHRCPANGKAYGQVSVRTIKHQIKSPWLRPLKNQEYYFCSDPSCEVVYFGQDNSVIEKHSLRSEVGVKEESEYALICYCYGITKAEMRTNPQIRDFVMAETERKNCACETRNPSGKCCLADFARY